MSLEELVARTELKSLHQIHPDFRMSYLQVLQLAKRVSAGLMIIVARNHTTLGSYCGLPRLQLRRFTLCPQGTTRLVATLNQNWQSPPPSSGFQPQFSSGKKIYLGCSANLWILKIEFSVLFCWRPQGGKRVK